MGRLRTPPVGGGGSDVYVVQASFEVFGWYPNHIYLLYLKHQF